MCTEQLSLWGTAIITDHLCFFSYVATAAALDRETNGAVRKFEVCDNVDLEMMLLEFESYHYIKFQKYPKVVRRATAGMKAVEAGGGVATQTSAAPLTVCLCAADSRMAGAVPHKR